MPRKNYSKWRTYYIYGLADPDTDEIMYVGQALDVKGRYSVHISAAKAAEKHVWINNLLNRGKEPKLVILEEVGVLFSDNQGLYCESKHNVHDAEREAILRLRPKFNRTIEKMEKIASHSSHIEVSEKKD